MRPAILLHFLRRELRDMRQAPQVGIVHLLMPLIGVLILTMFTVVGPDMVMQAQLRNDVPMLLMVRTASAQPEFASFTPEMAVTRFMLRNLAGFFLLMPVILSSTAAAFSIVGEKQQRTLEPVLATPITDSEFLFAKLTASLLPALVLTWAAAAAGTIIVDIISLSQYGQIFLPDRFWLVALLFLAPVFSTAAVLATMRLSARATDPQTAVQMTALFILPGFMIILGSVGRLLAVNLAAVVITGAVVLLLALYLFRWNVRNFQREEILTRWK